MRVLFITATRLGDAVLSTGILGHLLRAAPDARFTVACGPVAAGLFARMPALERIIIVEKRRHDLHWLRLWAECVGTIWDLAVDLRGSAVTLLLPARRRRIMRGGRRPGHRLTHLAGVLDLGETPLPLVWTAQEDDAQAAALLPAGVRWIGLGPTANWSGKAWPVANFAALFDALASRYPDLRPVIFAGPGRTEHDMAAPLLEILPGAVDLCGRLSLPAVAACLRRCALFVGNDSGLMHLAAAAGAPTLGLFGPSRVNEYGPSGPNARAAIAPGPDGAAPIGGLTVAAVLDQADALLR